MELLENELLHNILDFYCRDVNSVVRAMLVCKRWKEVVESIRFGRDVDYSGYPKSGFFRCASCNRVDRWCDERWEQFAIGMNDHFCSFDCFISGPSSYGRRMYKKRRIQ